jgi:hypothetical protein
MLLGQDFGGGHHSRLVTGSYCDQHRYQGDHGLAGADFPLEKPAHWPISGQVSQDFVEGPLLGFRKFEGQGRDYAFYKARVYLNSSAGVALPGKFLAHYPQLKEQKFVKGQAASGFLQ